MDNIKTLIRAFGVIFEMPRPESGNKARAYTVFGIIIFLVIMIPSCIMVGYITYLLSKLLMILGDREYALISLTHIISAFTMIFMMPVTFNVFYFSRDIPFLRSLPIRPAELFTAKFWHTFRTESFMSIGVILTMYIGWYAALIENFGISEALNLFTALSALLGLILIPMLPLIYCSVISILLVAVLSKAKRISIFYHSSTFLFIVFAFIFLFSFRGQGGVNVEKFVDMLVAGNNSFNDLCDVLFFSTPMVIGSMASGNILYLLLATLITFILYIVMMALAKLLYSKGLYTSLSLTNKVHSKGVKKAAEDQKNILSTLIWKEIKVLMRTMSYRTNCVYANLIWPVLSIVFFALSRKNANILRFISLYRGGQDQAQVIVLICVIAVSFIAAGLNSIAATSFTREGINIDMLKYLPVPANSFVISKAIAAMVFSYIPLSLSVVFASYSLGSGVIKCLLYLLVALISAVIAIAVGITFDSISPYTVWSDEATALRGNMNCFFNLGIGMLTSAVICGLCYLTYYLGGSFGICLLVTLGLLILMAAIASVILTRSVRRNLGI